MPEGYRQLTYGERCRVGALKESGLSDGAIAARLGRDRSLVWRELRRPATRRRVRPGSGRVTPSLRRWPVLHFGLEVGKACR